MRLWPSVVLLAAVLPVLCFGQAEGTDKPLPTPSEVLLEIPKCAVSLTNSFAFFVFRKPLTNFNVVQQSCLT